MDNTQGSVNRIHVSPSKSDSTSPTRSSDKEKQRAIGAGWYIEEADDRDGGDATGSGKDEQPDKPREPFIFIRWITGRPGLCFAVALGSHVFFLVLSGVLVLSGYDLIPANFQDLPLELRDQPWLKRTYAWDERNEYPDRVSRVLPSSKYPTWDRAFTREGLLLFYDAGGGGNIFSKDKLQAMQAIEQRLVSVSQFSTYCQMTQAGTCKPPVSVLRFFDGTYSSVDAVFNDNGFNNINNVLYAAYTYNETKSAFLYALGKNNHISSTSVSSTLTRTLIPLGWPLQGYTSESDMLNALAKFMKDHMEPVLSSYLDASEFGFTFYNNRLMLEEVRAQAYYDMALAVGSMVFIFLFIWFHTRSLFITCLAELGIVSSFVETNFIYRVVIGYKYFGYFHVLAMFIILGIGADDLFVFWDAWKATGLLRHPSLAHRLNDAYRKSVISMLVTSLTTMTAFLSNALSPLLATSSFGVFAAIMVGINYISVITYFPAVLIFYHKHFEDKPHPCCCCWKKKDKVEGTEDVESKYTAQNGHAPQVSTVSHNPRNSVLTFHGQAQNQISASKSPGKNSTSPSRASGRNSASPAKSIERTSASPTKSIGNGSTVRRNSKPQKNTEDKVEEPTGEKPSKLVIFFRDYYFAVITHKVARWVIVLAMVGCLAGFAYSATNLEPDNEQIQLYTDSHHYSRAINYNNYGFVPSDQDPTLVIYLVWGIKENDLSDCHFSSVNCWGTHQFYDSFDASSAAAQQAFVRICDTMFNFTDAQVKDFAIRKHLVTGELEIACFPRNMETFLKADPALNSTMFTMPWDWTKTSAFMTTLNTHYNSKYNSSFTHLLDIPITYWIWDKFQQTNNEDYQVYNHLFGEETSAYSSSVLSAPTIQTGNRIKYMAISVNTTLNFRSMGYTEGIPIIERWEQFMENQLKTMPAGMKSGFQISRVSWHWMYVQRALVDNAVLGIALGLSLAFPVLVLATCNVINGFLATLTIGFVTVCVVGVIPLGGWKLGVLVSLNMCLVVGLAVDFVVHLAEGYHMSHHSDRKGRLQQALERMGISVFSGACTTLGASAFMLFAKIQFFFQFGIFMFCTIGFSLLFSMGLYVTIMGIFGPQGNIGDIRVFFRKCCACVRPKNKPGCSQTTVANGQIPTQNSSAPPLGTGH